MGQFSQESSILYQFEPCLQLRVMKIFEYCGSYAKIKHNIQLNSIELYNFNNLDTIPFIFTNFTV